MFHTNVTAQIILFQLYSVHFVLFVLCIHLSIFDIIIFNHSFFHLDYLIQFDICCPAQIIILLNDRSKIYDFIFDYLNHYLTIEYFEIILEEQFDFKVHFLTA